MTNPWRPDSGHGTMWLVAAIALHAGVFGALMLLPARGATSSRSADIVIELAVEAAPTPPVDEAAAPPSSDEAATPAVALDRAVGARAPSTRPAILEAPGPASSTEPSFLGPPAAGEGTGTGVSPIPYTAGQLGLGGIGKSNPFLPKHEEPQPSPTERQHIVLRGTGLAHDTALGLGPEGPALSALSEGARMSIAPLRGRATFRVTSDRDGLVASVDLVDSDGGDWLDAAKLALEALKSKRFRVPRGANGLAMRIEISSDVTLPNGERAPIGVRSGANGAPEMTMPDISNIGASARRVVHSRILSTELL